MRRCVLGHNSSPIPYTTPSRSSLGRLELRAAAPVPFPAPPLTLGLHAQVRVGPQLLAHNTELINPAVSGPAGVARCCPRPVPCTAADSGAACAGACWATTSWEE